MCYFFFTFFNKESTEATPTSPKIVAAKVGKDFPSLRVLMVITSIDIAAIAIITMSR